jgi:arginyl-tRNA synthetase
MLRKSGEEKPLDHVDWSVLNSTEARELALRCARYGEAMQRAGADHDTSIVAGYLLDLAKAFSRFYRACPVLAAPDPALRDARLELSRCVHAVLQHGLQALGIETLASM